MYEEESISQSSGVLEVDIREDDVKLIIRKQDRYHFIKETRVGSRRYLVGSSSVVEYTKGSSQSQLFLKGNCDSYREDVEIIVDKSDWQIFNDLLIGAGFKIIDINAPVEEPKKDEEIPTYSFKDTTEEPTDEEIDKMIDLVDLNVFTSIIKARMKDEGQDGEELGKINRTWAKRYLKQWAKSKYRFYKLFGDKLKIERDLDVTPGYEYFETARRELSQKLPLYAPIIKNISTEAFQHDTIYDYGCWNEVRLDKRFTNGMSLTKFLALFGSEEMNIEVSKVYQNKDKAHLTISIDPNDFLTVSINSSGWRSCHNFIDGEWRNAGLSYMVDDVSLVSFKSNGEVNYKISGQNFRWNSKNWRQMIYMSKENSTIIFSRQYPNSSDEMSQKIREILEEVVCEYYNVENKWKKYSNVEAANVETENEDLLYNDVNNDFGHTVVRHKYDKDLKVHTDIYLGGKPKRVTDMRYNIEGCEDCL